MPDGQSIVYRLNRLAEIGYCAELGRQQDDRTSVRLVHPRREHDDLIMHEDGSISVPTNPSEDVLASAGADSGPFEALVAKRKQPRLSFWSRYTYEVWYELLALLVLNAVTLSLFAVAFVLWWSVR